MTLIYVCSFNGPAHGQEPANRINLDELIDRSAGPPPGWKAPDYRCTTTIDGYQVIIEDTQRELKRKLPKLERLTGKMQCGKI